MKDPARILLVRLSHLGDVVHALPVFHALHEAYPRAEIAWAIQPEFAELVRPLSGLARTIPFGRGDGWRAWPRLARELRGFAPDLAVDAQANLKSALVTWLSRAERRVGLARADAREKCAALALTESAPALPASARHAMQRMLALATHVAPNLARPPRMDPALTPAELASGERQLRERFPGAVEGAVLLGLSTPGDIRSWPRSHWLGLARALERDGVAHLVLSGPAEETLGLELAATLPKHPLRSHWIAQRGLRELAGVFAAASRQGLRMISCDSGPMHLAAACGLSVVALEGPQDAARTGPWPIDPDSRHLAVRAPNQPKCAPCLARRCTHERGPVCMSELDPRALLEAMGATRSIEAVEPPR